MFRFAHRILVVLEFHKNFTSRLPSAIVLHENSKIDSRAEMIRTLNVLWSCSLKPETVASLVASHGKCCWLELGLERTSQTRFTKESDTTIDDVLNFLEIGRDQYHHTVVQVLVLKR